MILLRKQYIYIQMIISNLYYLSLTVLQILQILLFETGKYFKNVLYTRSEFIYIIILDI